MIPEERKIMLRRIDACLGIAAFAAAAILYVAALAFVVYVLSQVVPLFWAILVGAGAAILALPLLHHGLAGIYYFITLYFAPVELRASRR